MSSYSDDFTERNVVDFENGKARAEVLLPRKTAVENPQKVLDKLKNEVEDMVTQDTLEDPVSKIEDESKQDKIPQPTKEEAPEADATTSREAKEVDFSEPVLSGQVETSDGKAVTEDNADEYSEEVVTEESTTTEPVRGEDGKERIKASVQVDLIPDHTEKRARRYLDHVRNQSSRFELEPSVILAVMHTESSFNPKARSPIPAYGLMQLVPASGGKASYKHIYGRERLLKPAYLYLPKNNVELGAGYLDLLFHQYFDGIENPRSRLYCAVAAYNTGPGNLARTFVGEMNVSAAIDRVNEMAPDDVYSKLRRSLPYEETKKYIKRVRERRRKYKQWLMAQ
jgi:membrane-bound lytic murein transglycosylase C